jgi:shikimate kinase
MTALVLIGPMGAGKSSIGRKVAKTLGTTFTDTDSLIVQRHGAIAEFFAEHGEAQFRLVERDAVVEALARGGVVALGGGSVLDAETRRDLARHRVVLLTVSPRIVRARIQGESRPLLTGGEDPLRRWERILAERRPLYDAVADVTFDTSSGPISGVVAEIAAWAVDVGALGDIQTDPHPTERHDSR